MTFSDAPKPGFSVLKSLKIVADQARARIETPFMRRQRLIQERIAVYRSLSDAELTQIGLTRNEIVPHVLRTTSRIAHLSR